MAKYLKTLTLLVIFAISFVKSEHASFADSGIDSEPKHNYQNIASKPVLKVENGEDSEIVPWMVVFLRHIPEGLTTHCGGSVISEKHILSAAHCFWPADPASYTARVGERDLLDDHDNAADYRLKQINNHEKYVFNPNLLSPYDITVIEVVGKIIFNDFVAPIALATPGDNKRFKNFDGKNLHVTGFGVFKHYSSIPYYPSVLQKTTLVGVPEEECRSIWAPHPIAPELLCARKNKQRPCGGDSGGPLVYMAKEPLLVGIANGAISCRYSSHYELPSVFTKVSLHYSWIMLYVNGNYSY